MDEKDCSLDGKDRVEWDRVWAAMPHRRLPTPPLVEVTGPFGSDCGEVVSVTISEDPPQFSSKAWRESENCPICGATTVGAPRLPATLHPTFANGLSFGLGVWAHRHCFECCPAVGEPAPIPW